MTEVETKADDAKNDNQDLSMVGRFISVYWVKSAYSTARSCIVPRPGVLVLMSVLVVNRQSKYTGGRKLTIKNTDHNKQSLTERGALKFNIILPVVW